MRLIPEQIEWYLDQINFDKKKAREAIEAQQELSNIERYKASAYGNQDGATGAEQSMFEQSLYYDNKASEYKNALLDVKLPEPDVDSDTIEIGSYVTVVDTIVCVEGNQEKNEVKTSEVLLIEGELGNRRDLDIKCASSESPMGKAILGAHYNDVVVFEIKRGKNSTAKHFCRIAKVDNNFIYERYAKHYENGSLIDQKFLGR